jgi:hypothetical protein
MGIRESSNGQPILNWNDLDDTIMHVTDSRNNTVMVYIAEQYWLAK